MLLHINKKVQKIMCKPRQVVSGQFFFWPGNQPFHHLGLQSTIKVMYF